ncbi:hypothetical protein BJ138DRAFT_8107 [Hygrophoropsis aurantiaca]|uniref:Uncharacterized protein n=1 Tax=Hygrophoropsis aurantiaca TaxID=72124 RepID=A0ACB8ATC2_9AGAM|nr:hypothetical protein BJ138DRAFT_8107 [Hygrophoropsis aurantiaca]
MPRKPRSLRNLALSPKRSSSPGPPSPTFSDATHASAMNFGADGPEKVITRSNLKVSLQAYDELMNSSANYRAALIHMSKATAAFADAMERCSGCVNQLTSPHNNELTFLRLKGPSYEAGTRLQAAAGFHHLIGNHWHVLAETLDKSFEKPLRQHLDTYRTIVTERSASYEKALREKSEIIRRTEMSNMNKKQRNLQSFREALTVLQRQVDELDGLKVQHYQEIMEHEEEVWDVVQAKVCVAVRSTMDVFDRFTAKASDPILEPMLQSVPDPFDSYGPPQAEDQIFTILPPLAVIANAPSGSPSPMTTTPPSSTDTTANNSWVSNNYFSESTSEWADVPSPSSTPPRSASPRSSSPSATVKRRQSHPPSSKRKAESNLRSVLAVLDDSRPHSRQASERTVTPVEKADGRSTPTPPDINGGPHTSETGWGQIIYGQSPYTTPSGDATPRHSAMFHSPPSKPEDEESFSPQSDDTVHFNDLNAEAA